MGSCAAPSAKGDDKFITTDYLQQCHVFYVQGYSGFGVTPSHIVCKILAEGINGGSERYRLMSSIPHATIYGRDSLRLLLVSAGKLIHQTAGFWKGRN
ncbi:hypothetical protein CPY09_12025 [Salmonella enterica subsp. enterica serovar Typhimurium]|nr:FAD-binding oxidoreductase [Salmonella enterica]EDM1957880.1 hypothetical protein [Salmonella enterica subsp. enterica serovar Typhimurium]MMX89144.1 FAD-binding oxidoreductase [Salmonella enterica]